jgi:hypothetical protein
MANSDKNIIIVPNTNQSGLPNIQFVGSSSAPISLNVLDDNTVSFSGSQGQLFAINNNLTSGTIFSVNDVSGIPMLEVNASGTVSMARFGTGVAIGKSTANGKLDISGSTVITGTLNVTSTTTLAAVSGTTAQFTIVTGSTVTGSSGQFTSLTSSVLFLDTNSFPTTGLTVGERANIAVSSSLYTTKAITAGGTGNGTSTHPTYNFSVQPGTGMYFPANNTLAFAINTVESVRIERSTYSRLGVNEANPQGLIHASLSTSSADIAKIVLENTGGANTNMSYDLWSVQGLKTRLINVPYNANGFGEWTGGGVIHSSGSTVLSNQSNLHYSAVTHRWYKNAGSGSADRVMTLNSSGNLELSGNLTVTGSITELSTRRIKTNIQSMTNQLHTVNQLNPVSYIRLDDNRKEYGFISEEVKEVYPEFVVGEGINYPKMVSVLVSAVKELTQKVEKQQIEIEQLKNKTSF